jgi:hypothetical protein
VLNNIVYIYMPCKVSCMISAIFIIGMIYFYNITGKSEIVKKYKETLSPELNKFYDKISKERLIISYQGYALGLLLSLVIIFYNLNIKMKKLNTISLVCIVISVMFITNYLYYILHPKSDWVLNHIDNKDQNKAWLKMYRNMQYNYHLGLALGIIGVGIFAFAFRC